MILSAIVDVVRGRLEDDEDPYLWSNEYLTGCVSQTINDLCRRVTPFALIVDASTEALVKFTMLAEAHTITLSERITRVMRAKLASQTGPLIRALNVTEMDASVPGWESTPSGSPTHFIEDGVGTNQLRLWPALKTADVLWLTVARMPLADLVWATDQGSSPAIPERYHDQLYDGIMARAYLKDDTDTLDLKKSMIYEARWAQTINDIKASELRRTATNHSCAPHDGHI